MVLIILFNIKTRKMEIKKATTNKISSDFLREATSYSHRGNPPTTIGAKELNFCVRHGNRCDLFAIVTSLAHGCAGVCVATWMLRL